MVVAMIAAVGGGTAFIQFLRYRLEVNRTLRSEIRKSLKESAGLAERQGDFEAAIRYRRQLERQEFIWRTQFHSGCSSFLWP